MAYSDFTTIRQVEKQFGVRQVKKNIFTDVKPTLPSSRLLEELQEAEELPLFSEKAKSELIIMPILKEVRRKNRTFNIFSGYSFDVDKAQSLNGICDYILSSNIESIEIKSPIFCLVEAKNRTIEEGIGQAAAEMIAAKIFNKQDKNELPAVYGCVTTGTEWLFLLLEDEFLCIHTHRYYLNETDLPKLLSILLYIVEQSV